MPPTDVSTVIENCASLAVGVNGAYASDGSESPLTLCAVTGARILDIVGETA